MVFSSSLFLTIFLPLLLAIYFLSPRCLRNVVLLSFSLVFYAWGEPHAVWVMIMLMVANYVCAMLGGWLLILGIVLDLGALFFYKYLGFAVENVNSLAGFFGVGGRFAVPDIALPIGISFYVFQLVSYLIDVRRKAVPVQKNPLDFMLYVSLFPQLIAGPIVRYSTIAADIANRALHLDNVHMGLRRFAVGLAKKVLIADTMSEIADCVFNSPVEGIPGLWCWIGALTYSLQIFFDFSGYSDMAIGLGRIFNFRFLENFEYPYSACSVRDFWRRWHISLSSWLRDYLYIPLGGNRCGAVKTYINLFVVFLACGIWHGAAWTFVAWGVYHGLGLVIERLGLGRLVERMPRIVGNAYTLIFVIVGWVVFRAESMTYAVAYLKNMFLGNGMVSGVAFLPALRFVSIKAVVIFAIGAAMSYPYIPNICMKICGGIRTALALLLFAVSLVFAVTAGYSPFIYFRF